MRAPKGSKREPPTSYASYLRVSTDRQGRSGLGLEAQRTAVASFVRGSGKGHAKEFVEVESGSAKGRDGMRHRPVLREALGFCKEQGATLVIAKLDRLSRSVRFIAELLEARVPIRAADMPEANEFVLHIMAAVAQQERKAIRERTQAALAAAKARGTVLGNPRIAKEHARQRSEANAHALKVARTIHVLQAKGLSQREIIEQLNCDGVAALHGGTWYPLTLTRVLKRLKTMGEARRRPGRHAKGVKPGRSSPSPYRG